MSCKGKNMECTRKCVAKDSAFVCLSWYRCICSSLSKLCSTDVIDCATVYDYYRIYCITQLVYKHDLQIARYT